MNQADTKYAEAFAHDIAEVLRSAPQAAAVQVEVYDDPQGEGPAVRVRAGRTVFELLMPAPGAMFALFRNGAWHGGIGLRISDADPRQVALALLTRMGRALRA